MVAITSLAYLVASLLFILCLSGLSAPSTAKKGNLYGVVGMGIAAVFTLLAAHAQLPAVVAALVVGGAIGLVMAQRVGMTSMPQLVAGMHSFVGIAATLVGVAGALHGFKEGVEGGIERAECFVGVNIGAVTFTGSLIAFGKLQELIGSRPLVFSGRHALNAVLLGAVLVFGGWFVVTGEMLPMWLGIAAASLLGVLLVMGIGGADMPVVVSMLNSYSGWAASATGFLLGNDALIVVGALVGSSGAILSYIMCKAMNRSFVSVILGGFGAVVAGDASEQSAALAKKGVQQAGPEDVVELMKSARNIIVVPGYGMAVAQAQHVVRELTELCQKAGSTVRYAIHPVAGRLPGHMNVLLAEANVPYPIVLEMDEINHDFSGTDLVLVIGANDIVNPDALENPKSPIAGMPVLEVWKAATVVTVKRGLNPGFAGIDNPLYYRDNSLMLFGDAKKMVEALVSGMKGSH